MSLRHRLLLLLSLFLIFTLLVMVSNSEAGRRHRGKKNVTSSARKSGKLPKKRLRGKVVLGAFRPAQLEEAYLVAEFSPPENARLQKALGLLGIRYRFGGNSYTGIDCSAFVKRVFAAQNLPRTAREQYLLGENVSPDALQKGDLLFFQTYAQFPSHVGINIGNKLMIHASSGGGKVMISRWDTPYFSARFLGARRIPAAGDGFLWELEKDGAQEEEQSDG